MSEMKWGFIEEKEIKEERDGDEWIGEETNGQRIRRHGETERCKTHIQRDSCKQ